MPANENQILQLAQQMIGLLQQDAAAQQAKPITKQELQQHYRKQIAIRFKKKYIY